MLYFSSPLEQPNTHLDTVSLYIISKDDSSKFICVPHAAPRFLMLWKEETHERAL